MHIYYKDTCMHHGAEAREAGDTRVSYPTLATCTSVAIAGCGGPGPVAARTREVARVGYGRYLPV